MKKQQKLHNKVRIIGSVGSGKTTLARRLSRNLNIPYYELDNVIRIREPSGDVRRSEGARDAYLNSIVEKDNWIIEGVHNEEWTGSTFANADLIIFLDLRYHLRTFRIIKRFIRQKLGIEPANYQPTFSIFFKMFKWNRTFEKVGKPNVHRLNQIYKDKFITIKSPEELVKLLS